MLIAAGADVNAADRVQDATPLHVGALIGSEPLIRLLLAAGANPGLKDAAGRVPAQVASEAAYPGHTAIVQRLTLEAGSEARKTALKKQPSDENQNTMSSGFVEDNTLATNASDRHLEVCLDLTSRSKLSNTPSINDSLQSHPNSSRLHNSISPKFVRLRRQQQINSVRNDNSGGNFPKQLPYNAAAHREIAEDIEPLVPNLGLPENQDGITWHEANPGRNIGNDNNPCYRYEHSPKAHEYNRYLKHEPNDTAVTTPSFENAIQQRSMSNKRRSIHGLISNTNLVEIDADVEHSENRYSEKQGANSHFKNNNNLAGVGVSNVTCCTQQLVQSNTNDYSAKICTKSCYYECSNGVVCGEHVASQSPSSKSRNTQEVDRPPKVPPRSKSLAPADRALDRNENFRRSTRAPRPSGNNLNFSNNNNGINCGHVRYRLNTPNIPKTTSPVSSVTVDQTSYRIQRFPTGWSYGHNETGCSASREQQPQKQSSIGSARGSEPTSAASIVAMAESYSNPLENTTRPFPHSASSDATTNFNSGDSPRSVQEDPRNRSPSKIVTNPRFRPSLSFTNGIPVPVNSGPPNY